MDTLQKDKNQHLVSMYINSLTSQHSKKTMALALRRGINFLPQVDQDVQKIFSIKDWLQYLERSASVSKEQFMTTNKRGLIKNSTREFYREGKNTADYSLFDFLHGYMYLKWPYLYISVALGDHRLYKVIQPIFLFIQSIMEPSQDDEPEDQRKLRYLKP